MRLSLTFRPWSRFGSTCLWLLLSLAACGNSDEATPAGVEPVPPTTEAPTLSYLTLTDWFPSEADTNVPRNTVLLLAFAEAPPQSVAPDPGFLQAAPGEPLTGSWTQSGHYVTFYPDTPFPSDQTQTLTLSSTYSDQEHWALQETPDWVFATTGQLDREAPAVLTSTLQEAPEDLPDNVSLQWTFSEPLNPASVAAAVTVAQEKAPQNGTVVLDGTTLTFTPEHGWTANATYTATLSAALEDLAGNHPEPRQQAFHIQNGVLAEADAQGLIKLSGGTFQMGADNASLADDSAGSNEQPAHAVTLSHPFWIADHELTVTEYQACVDAEACTLAGMSSSCNALLAEHGDYPMNCLSWEQGQTYLTWLSTQEDRHFRYCTEAEWEYAARAGTESKWWCGNDTCTTDTAWYDSTSRSNPQPVRAKTPNAWGLYDVHGNVWEWVQDFYSGSTYGQDADGVTDPTGPESGNTHVLRGGGYSSEKKSIRAAKRWYANPTKTHYKSVGMRICADE